MSNNIVIPSSYFYINKNYQNIPGSIKCLNKIQGYYSTVNLNHMSIFLILKMILKALDIKVI